MLISKKNLADHIRWTECGGRHHRPHPLQPGDHSHRFGKRRCPLAGTDGSCSRSPAAGNWHSIAECRTRRLPQGRPPHCSGPRASRVLFPIRVFRPTRTTTEISLRWRGGLDGAGTGSRGAAGLFRSGRVFSSFPCPRIGSIRSPGNPDQFSCHVAYVAAGNPFCVYLNEKGRTLWYVSSSDTPPTVRVIIIGSPLYRTDRIT